ncbi:DnaJ domain-containing protein [Persephonella sp.]
MNLYQILGVDRKATPEEIKKAFREKARKYHPDINPEYEEYFKQITHAYDILIDPEKRKKYDLALKKIEKKEFGQILGDILAEFLGFHTKPLKGEDIKIKLKITPEEGFSGTVKEVKYKRKVKCTTCSGTGITHESRLVQCDRCRGTGRVKKAFIEIPCISCFGRGVKIINPCPVCSGNGRVLKFETKKIKIPAGITEKQELVLENAGNDGINGGKAGSLKIKLQFIKSRYRLKKLDLITEIKISREKLAQARFFTVEDIEGRLLKIPVDDHSKPVKYRIKNRGYRDTKGRRGDLIVRLIPV